MFTRTRLGGSSERGFTVIELLVVVIIIGMLLAIALPSYMGFRDRAANNETKASLRAALPAATAYFADNGTYVGMDEASLREIDSTLSPTLSVAQARSDSYCLMDSVKGKTWSVLGPAPGASSFVPNRNCSGAS